MIAAQRIVLAVWLCALAASVARAETVDEVIARHIEARGGAEKLAAMKMVRQAEQLDMGGGKSATLVSEQKRPNLMRMELVLPGMTAVRAFDGKNGWNFLPQMGQT
ncbi:hypothetical protein BH09PLA1_BH09PLA1_32000 [soil metagenome]